MSVDIFRHADESLMVMLREMSREFQNMATEIGFEELNVLETRKRVNAMYKRLDAVIRREYRRIARKAYADACDEAQVWTTFNAAAFVDEALKAYDTLSDFVYTREWTRKRDRLFESIIATEVPRRNPAEFAVGSLAAGQTDKPVGFAAPGGNQEMRRNLKRGLDVLANQVRQYADNITAYARLEAFKRAGIDAVVWITEKDEKVCKVCAPRDEQVYPIEWLPEWPAHWHCRCRIEIVDMEALKRRRARD